MRVPDGEWIPADREGLSFADATSAVFAYDIPWEKIDTARIPILVVTAKAITAEDRTRLNGYVTAIMEKTDFDRDRFRAEVRRAMSGRAGAA